MTDLELEAMESRARALTAPGASLVWSDVRLLLAEAKKLRALQAELLAALAGLLSCGHNPAVAGVANVPCRYCRRMANAALAKSRG